MPATRNNLKPCSTNMCGHSLNTLNKFFDLCQGAFDVWQIHLTLFDKNPRKAELAKSEAGDGLYSLSVITQEHFLHQIAKLHDLAIQQGNANLTIDYIVRFGGWDATTLNQLQDLKSKLDAFAEHLKKARNKVLSHNDLETLLNEPILGAFPVGEDTKYFDALQQFVNVVSKTVCEDPMRFRTEAMEDAVKLASSIAIVPKT